MSIADGKLGPMQIADLAREVDTNGRHILMLEQVAELIEREN